MSQRNSKKCELKMSGSKYVPELPPKTKKPEYVHHPSLPLVSKYRQGTESLHDDTR